ncbi:hypothetical protein ACP4OV_021172 [Aristida adscensionis]
MSKLQRIIDSLEAALGDMKEFVFLLQPCSFPGVLPITGPPDVGKKTLVEHVCADERVRRRFSLITRLCEDDLEDGDYGLSPEHGATENTFPVGGCCSSWSSQANRMRRRGKGSTPPSARPTARARLQDHRHQQNGAGLGSGSGASTVAGLCLYYDRCKQTGAWSAAGGELPNVTLQEVLDGSVVSRGEEEKMEVLGWRSRILPYHNYLANCAVEKPATTRRSRYLKRKERVL